MPSARRVAVTVTADRPGWLNETVGFEPSGSSVVKVTRSVWPGLHRVADGVAANALAQTGRTRTDVPSADDTVSRASYRPCGGEAAVRQAGRSRPRIACPRAGPCPVHTVRTSAPDAVVQAEASSWRRV